MEFTTELSTERGMGLCMDKAIYHDNSCCFYTGNIYDYAGGKAACESLKGHLIKLVPLELYVSIYSKNECQNKNSFLIPIFNKI